MGTKEQFKMYLQPEQVERLEELAAKYGRRSGQQIAEEILSVYIPVWVANQDAIRRAMAYQSGLDSDFITFQASTYAEQFAKLKESELKEADGYTLTNKRPDGVLSDESESKAKRKAR